MEYFIFNLFPVICFHSGSQDAVTDTFFCNIHWIISVVSKLETVVGKSFTGRNSTFITPGMLAKTFITVPRVFAAICIQSLPISAGLVATISHKCGWSWEFLWVFVSIPSGMECTVHVGEGSVLQDRVWSLLDYIIILAHVTFLYGVGSFYRKYFPSSQQRSSFAPQKPFVWVRRCSGAIGCEFSSTEFRTTIESFVQFS